MQIEHEPARVWLAEVQRVDLAAGHRDPDFIDSLLARIEGEAEIRGQRFGVKDQAFLAQVEMTKQGAVGDADRRHHTEHPTARH